MTTFHQERGLPTRTPTTLRESSRRLQCHLILAEAGTPPAEEDAANVSPRTAGFEAKGTTSSTKSSEPKPGVEVPGEAERAQAAATDGDGVASVHWAVAAERLAQEAVELAPGDPRPWQALAEACEAQGGERFAVRLFLGLLPLYAMPGFLEQAFPLRIAPVFAGVSSYYGSLSFGCIVILSRTDPG